MASGYDLSSKVPFRLLKGRLGIYQKQPFDLREQSLQGIHGIEARFRANGGNIQQDRMIRDKRRTLDRATQFSYQAAKIFALDAEDQTPVPALITPDKVKLDYDDKILSVGYEYNIRVGDVIQWTGTDTYWLVHLQDSTELAYFRGEIRKCTHSIVWQDNDGDMHSTYAAIKGPKETKIISMQKHGISIDQPNLSLTLMMPQNPYVLEYFKRYSKFYLQGDETCWRVQTTDWISSPNILEVTAVEDYSNKDEDDIEAGIVGSLIPEAENPNGDFPSQIIGETFIKVQKTYGYTYNGNFAGEWSISEGCPVKMQIDPNNPKSIKLKWENSYSGQFDLYYGNQKKTIVVESLF